MDCLTGGVFDPNSRGTNDRFIDHVFGGTGGTSASSLAGDLGADLLDFNPRGSYNPGTGCTANTWPLSTGSGKNVVTIDPCAWFVMTDKADDTAYPATLVNNQHHQGTDWLYGGYNDVRQQSPAMQTFLQQLAWGSSAGRSSTDVTTSGTSAFRELALVYSGDINGHGAGQAFSGTSGHFDDPAACSD